ncbi:Uncharacterized protein dnm_019870 [Desulfonema magnum]|uniref:Uncharacterized protein n=1 Tax=Desulfonema magnum TaxID=45655 RepID=A0A975BIL4_9BACT|nr:Uncharacterized protein dnm_019870 [Desulfonema magnum]
MLRHPTGNPFLHIIHADGRRKSAIQILSLVAAVQASRRYGRIYGNRVRDICPHRFCPRKNNGLLLR